MMLVWFAIIILAIDSLHLTSNTVLVEQGLLEELRKYIDCFRELLRGYIKVEISLVVTCVCIGFSSIITHILQVVILLWIFFGSLEEHVFTEMSHSVKLLTFVIWVLRITQASYSHVHACSAHFCFRIVDQECLKFIRELDVSIIPNITDTFHDVIREYHLFLCQHYYYKIQK